MNWSHLGLAVLLVGAATLAAEGGAYGTVSAARSSDVFVTAEETALLSVSAPDERLVNGHHDSLSLATITNRLTTPVTFRASVSDEYGTPPNVQRWSVTDRLAVRETGQLTVDVVCGPTPTPVETFVVELYATGTDTSVRTTVGVDVRCSGDPPGLGSDRPGKGPHHSRTP